MKRYDPFVKHHRALLQSHAWRALSGDGHKVLSRIELEHLAHGGRNNGNLIVPYNDFEVYCVGHRRVITRGLREAEALGLLQIIRGRGGNGEFCAPNQYRLTYLPCGSDQPTDDWNEIKSIDDAMARLKSAKKPPRRNSSSGVVLMPAFAQHRSNATR
jgi:hypothetical protein